MPKVQQVEVIEFQDPQATAATSGSQHQYIYIYIYIYIKFFGGKIFSAKRVVFSGNILKCGAQQIFAKNCALLVVVKLPLLLRTVLFWYYSLGYYAASSGNFTATRRAQFLAKISCHYSLCNNPVSSGNSTATRRAQFSATSRWHPQITQIFAGHEILHAHTVGHY